MQINKKFYHWLRSYSEVHWDVHERTVVVTVEVSKEYSRHDLRMSFAEFAADIYGGEVVRSWQSASDRQRETYHRQHVHLLIDFGYRPVGDED